MPFFSPPPRNPRPTPDLPVSAPYAAYAPKPVTPPRAVPPVQAPVPIPESPPMQPMNPPVQPMNPPSMPMNPPMQPMDPPFQPMNPPDAPQMMPPDSTLVRATAKPPVKPPVMPPKPPVMVPVVPPPAKPPVMEKPPVKPPMAEPVKPPVVEPIPPPKPAPPPPPPVCVTCPEPLGCGITLGMCAPQFKANSTFGPLCLSDFRGKWVILFSHPGDFTPVCTTEFMAFSQAWSDFQDRNAQLLGLSVDSNASHLAWVMNIYRHTGVEVPFPIIEDRSMHIARLYCMIHPGVSDTSTVRSVFFIDCDQKIRAVLQYPLTNGRNIQEILRLLDALQTTDRHKVATPANWVPGEPVIVPAPQTWKGVQEREKEGYTCIDWYLCFKDIGVK